MLRISLFFWGFDFGFLVLNKGTTTWNALCQQRILLEESERVCVGWASKVLFLDAWYVLAAGRSVLGQIFQHLEPEMVNAVSLKGYYDTCSEERASLKQIKTNVRSLLWRSGGVIPVGGGHAYEGIIQQIMTKKWAYSLLKFNILVQRRKPGFCGVTSFSFPSLTKPVLWHIHLQFFFGMKNKHSEKNHTDFFFIETFGSER